MLKEKEKEEKTDQMHLLSFWGSVDDLLTLIQQILGITYQLFIFPCLSCTVQEYRF